MQDTKTKIQTLLNIPMEEWHQHGVHFDAASANCHGQVNSALIRVGREKLYIYRVWPSKGEQYFAVEKR